MPPFTPGFFGKYWLAERIAAGGMAEVFRAVLRGAAGFEKTVALKRILPIFGSEPDFVTLFQDEARIASTLTHTNIAQTFDFGEVDGSYYLALEYIEGIDLARLELLLKAAQQPMPHATAVFIASEAARGLAYAHEKRGPDGQPLGIVHRDVSPQNVLVSYAGEVKVADFGIAKATGKVHKTSTGVVMGKLRYMSPEQVAGQPLDARSDVFSLGVILYELLTAGPMFPEVPGVALAEQIHTAPIEPPSARAGVPAELDPIVLRMVSRKREDRYPRMQDVARDLTVFLNRHAPGFTREDLGALVTGLAPPKPHAASSAPPLSDPNKTSDLRSPAPAFEPTEMAPSLPPRTAPRAPALIVDDVPPTAGRPATPPPSEPRQLDVPTRTRLADEGETTGPARPRTFDDDRSSFPARRRRRGGWSREAKLSLALGAIILGSGGLVLYKLLAPAKRAAAVAADAGAVAMTATDAGATGPAKGLDAGVAPATGPFQLRATVPPEAREALARRSEPDEARVVTWTPEAAALYTALDWGVAHLTLDASGAAEAAPRLPDGLSARLDQLRLRKAYDAVIGYVRATGDLPPRVKLAIKAALKTGAFGFGDVVDGRRVAAHGGATLALWLFGSSPQRLADVARQAAALDAWCEPISPPKRRFAPVACERTALLDALRAAGEETTARVLERWDLAGVPDAPQTIGGVAVRLAGATWELGADGKEYTLAVRLAPAAPLPDGTAIEVLAGDVAVTLKPREDDMPDEDAPDAGTSELTVRFQTPRALWAPVLQLAAGDETVTFRLPAPPFPLYSSSTSSP